MAWAVRGHGKRLAAVRKAAQRSERGSTRSPPVVSIRTFGLLTLAYPVRFGFWGAAMVPISYVTSPQRGGANPHPHPVSGQP